MTQPTRDRLLLVTHTSRSVDLAHCALNTLSSRYGAPERLADVPPFSSLPSLDAGWRSYEGSLSIHHLTTHADAWQATELAHFSPGRKIQHAAIVGSHLVLCFEDTVEIFDDWWSPKGIAPLENCRPTVIDDPWFAGLHTVFPESGTTALVSSSAADAVLRIDIEVGRVIDRLRLPSGRYGTNYELSAADSVKQHFIHNDLQIGHVNCASPMPDGGILLSALIPGLIGTFDAQGTFGEVTSGYVGAHGARFDADSGLLYFADSCLGALVFIDAAGVVKRRFSVDSRWLHDVQALAPGVFAFARAEFNCVDVHDIDGGIMLARLQFPDDRGSVQFLAVAELP